MEQKTETIQIANDILQFGNPLETPEIRVWCHPHYIGKSGDDYVKLFDTFQEAMDFCKKNKEAESTPLIGFRGYEINLFSLND